MEAVSLTTPTDLARTAMLRAIERRAEIRGEAEAIRRRVAERPELAKWSAMASASEVEAERSLVLAILATGEDFAESDVCSGAQQDRWPARGVRVDGRVFLAIPDPAREDDDDGGNGQDLMRLIIVDAYRILDLDNSGCWPVPAEVAPLEAQDSGEGSRPAVLSEEQSRVLRYLADLGSRETFDRLLLAGPYDAIWEAVNRLGTDAVVELRRVIAAR